MAADCDRRGKERNDHQERRQSKSFSGQIAVSS
jgi:hypothetical protein